MAIHLIMLGPPGAGKGTQAERFARDHGVPKISTGDILREAVQAGTPLGRQAKAIMAAGRLVSDEVMIGIVRERLERPDAAAGFVLDGFPRTVPQAEALDAIMAGRDPLIVVEIAVPEEELARRLRARRICSRCGADAVPQEGDGSSRCARCGGSLVQRSDDEAEVIRERLTVYARETRPLVEYYRRRPTFRVIDGNRPPDEAAADLREQVRRAAAPASSQAAATGAAGSAS